MRRFHADVEVPNQGPQGCDETLLVPGNLRKIVDVFRPASDARQHHLRTADEVEPS
jgi:hypothetical protein